MVALPIPSNAPVACIAPAPCTAIDHWTNRVVVPIRVAGIVFQRELLFSLHLAKHFKVGRAFFPSYDLTYTGDHSWSVWDGGRNSLTDIDAHQSIFRLWLTMW